MQLHRRIYIQVLSFFGLATKDLFPEVTASENCSYTREQRREIYKQALDFIKKDKGIMFVCHILRAISCNRDNYHQLFPEFMFQQPLFKKRGEAWWDRISKGRINTQPRIIALEKAIQLTY